MDDVILNERSVMAKYVGIADGAKVNWDFLEKHTERQILDFYHATEYLTDVARAALVLRLRALVCTKGCWAQFWERINQAGLSGLADIK